MNMRFFLLTLALIALFQPSVWAIAPNKVQSQCLLALQAAGAKVAETASRDAFNCIRKANKGQLTGDQLKSCLTGESTALQNTKVKTNKAASKFCSQLPDFGPQNAQEINNAYARFLDFNKVFGTDVAGVIKTKKQDASIASCQLAVASETASLARLEIAEYGRCSKRLIKNKKLASADDLQACIGAETTAIKKAKKLALSRLSNKCAKVTRSSAYPGQCADAPASELANCLAAQAHCDSCKAINAADHLNASGHTFKDGVASYYCGTRTKSAHSIARQWNEQNLAAIRIDTPRPPVHARNLFHLSASMYDAWAAFDTIAKPYLTNENAIRANLEQDREIAISFAAYRVLSERYSKKYALGYDVSKARFDALMDELGFDKNYTQTGGNGPAAVGNRIAAAVLAHGLTDGSNQEINYEDPTYKAVNKPLIVKQNGIDLKDDADSSYNLNPDRWQPLALDKTVTQNGIPLPDKIQTFIGSQWGDVTPFAITKASPGGLYLDPGPQPLLGGLGDAQFKTEVMEVIELASLLTPDDPTLIDISPASQGNNTLGTNDGNGYAINPITQQPYAPNLVKRGDFARILAEWWADGPTSETPPGHWNAIANAVADNPVFQRRIGGTGPVVNTLEWDVKTYFALNGATHDAAIAAWGAKRKYDGVRPITMVRYMAKMGQSSDPNKPHYHVNGLPLKDGLVELITTQSAAPGQKHAHLVTASAGGRIGDMAIYVWPGSPADVKTQYSGVKWVLGTSWVPYQRDTFVTPAFPGYISGHSTFSRAAAEVLAAITGSDYFPGGLYAYPIKKNAYLIHELGPSTDVTLQFATYFDAADQSGRSRLWGGIHVSADDFKGRHVGSQAGKSAYTKALSYFEGSGR